jgi:hypothetical protein
MNKPQLSRLTILLIVLLLLFSAVARPIANWLLANIGNMGIAVMLWLATLVLGLNILRYIYQLGWLRLFAGVLLAVSTVIYLASFDVVVERIHLIKFGSLAILICRDNAKNGLVTAVCYGFLISSSIGMLDELWQHYLPDRVGDWRDVLFNTIGSFWGVLCWLLMTPKKVNQSPNGSLK